MNLVYPQHSRYLLSDTENEMILVRQIIPDYFSAAHPSQNPTALLSGGQPGIGKTSARNTMARDHAPSTPFVVVNADDLREYHPQYAGLREQNDRIAYQQAHNDAARWMAKVIEHARRNSFNVVIDSTMVMPQVTGKTAQDFRQAGYSVGAVIVAGHESRSRLQILGRYVGLRLAGAGRYVNREDHDRAYRGVVANASRLEEDANVDMIAVRRYSGDGSIYENRRENGRWAYKPEAAKVIEQFRSRVPSQSEVNDYFRLLNDLLEKRFPTGQLVLDRQTWAPEIADIVSTLPGVTAPHQPVDAPSLQDFLATAQRQAQSHTSSSHERPDASKINALAANLGTGGKQQKAPQDSTSQSARDSDSDRESAHQSSVKSHPQSRTQE